jgi:UDP-3-O-[3-hydroxymyristoyl] N-acetylglucosamine deacetylase
MVEGVGLHTGERCAIRISPADERCGITFLVGADRTPIQANADNVGHWKRQTALVGEKASVGMVEHLLAALAGLGILHAIIGVTGPEVPALDGSALPFVELIEQAGTKALGGPMPRMTIPSPIIVENGESRLAAHAADRYALSVTVQYPDVGEQNLSLELTPETFKKELAPARTFGFAEEAKEILAAGLAAGASLENVVLVDRGRYSAPLRFPDELVRHKMLDLVGDLSLVGVPFDAHIEAVRPGHRVNVQLARSIASALSAISEVSPGRKGRGG